jgi:hypothetical protein
MSKGLYGRDETFAVKEALQKAGYKNVSVKHDTGTAANWIEVTLYGNYTRDDEIKAYGITKRAAHREHLHDDIQTDYFVENIAVHTSPTKPAPRPKSQFTTKGELKVISDEKREYGIRPGKPPAWTRTVTIKLGDYTYVFMQYWHGGYDYYRVDPHFPRRFPMPKRPVTLETLLRIFSKKPALVNTLKKTFG